MSVAIQGDNELRDLVSQTLENAGILSKIRAELRASVFLVLEEHEAFKGRNLSFTNNPLKNFLSSNEGLIITSLVREFLEFFGLEFTASVFDPETEQGNMYDYLGRSKLAQDLKLNTDTKAPLLAQVLKQTKSNNFVALPNNKDAPKEVLHFDKVKDDKSLKNNSNGVMKREALSNHSNKSPENSMKQVPIAENKVPSSQNITKKTDNLKLDLNQLSLKSSGNSMSSLGNLPPLGTGQSKLRNRSPDNRSTKQFSNDIKALLDYDTPDQNYEEDFHGSESEKASKGTNISFSGSGSEVEEEVSVGVDDHTTDISEANVSEKTA